MNSSSHLKIKVVLYNSVLIMIRILKDFKNSVQEKGPAYLQAQLRRCFPILITPRRQKQVRLWIVHSPKEKGRSTTRLRWAPPSSLCLSHSLRLDLCMASSFDQTGLSSNVTISETVQGKIMDPLNHSYPIKLLYFIYNI